MNCLVTGGAGFIGSNFIIYMLKKYRDINIINLDALTYAGNLENLRPIENHSNYRFVLGNICDGEAVGKIFRENGVDWVINFAAESHVDRSIANPGVFAETNVIGTLKLLEAAKAAWQEGGGCRGGVKFLQVSTDEVYGSLGETGLFSEADPLAPRSPYSASKASADMFVKAYADSYRLPVNITRCSNNYGPYQFPEKLIPLMINNALSRKPLPVYGDGLQIRDWLYVEDHCRAIDMVLRGGSPGEVYNIGGNNERTNLAIVNLILDSIREKAGKGAGPGLIRHVEDRKGHDRRYAVDASKIKNELGWRPETPFEEGIIKTVEWYLSERGWLSRATSGEYRAYYQKNYGGREGWNG